MSAPAAPAALPAMDSSIGAFLVGTILSIFLAGITSVQVYEYYQNFGRTDRALLIGIVSFLLVCDLFHTAISCFTIYFWTVTNYANPAVLVVSPWSFTWDPFLTGIVSFTVQLFYAWRVFVVSKRQWILPACIGVLSLLQLAFAVGSTWEIYLLESKFSRFGEFRYGVATWLLAAAAADILITSSLIWYLRQASNNDHQRSRSIVQRIIRITIETNGLTCLFAIADAILFVALPADSWHVVPNLSLVKLYFNGCLVSLNARTAFHQPTSGQFSGSYNPHTPAPKYSTQGQTNSSDLITPATLGSSYGSNGSPVNEKKGFSFGLNRGTSGSGDARRARVEGVQVTTVSETVTRIGSRDEIDMEKGLQAAPAQAFELSSIAHNGQNPARASEESGGQVVVPTLGHAYSNGSGNVGAPTSMGGTAVPREWA